MSLNAEINQLRGSSFFGKPSKFNVHFKNAKKVEKKFLVSEIIAYEMAAVNYLYYEGNTCHGHSMP